MQELINLLLVVILIGVTIVVLGFICFFILLSILRRLMEKGEAREQERKDQ